MSIGNLIGIGVLGSVLVLGGVGGCMWGMPKYRVYSQEMVGKATLARATADRQVAIEEAKAFKESATYKAQAEVIRAEGVADANKIIADGLGGAEGYLRYLAIDGMKEMAKSQNTTVVYVPTDGNIPVTEASRFNKPMVAPQE